MGISSYFKNKAEKAKKCHRLGDNPPGPFWIKREDMSDISPESHSLEEVAKSLSVPLHRYLERMVGNTATADDLLQESLLRISNGLSGFRGKSSLKTWAFSIATRVVADHFRRPETKSRIVDIDDAEEPPDSAIDVDERIIVEDMNACIREVIESLPDDYRAALVLHDLEGLSAAETAEICGCTLAATKIRIHRARARLKHALERECSFYHDKENVLRCDRKSPSDPCANGPCESNLGDCSNDSDDCKDESKDCDCS